MSDVDVDVRAPVSDDSAQLTEESSLIFCSELQLTKRASIM